MNTIYCKVLEKENDICGYHTLVFENLDTKSFDSRYLMVVVFPNWMSYIPEKGEIGYLTYKTVIEGVDKWYDGKDFIPYNYTNIIFIKFVLKKEDISKEIIL